MLSLTRNNSFLSSGPCCAKKWQQLRENVQTENGMISPQLWTLNFNSCSMCFVWVAGLEGQDPGATKMDSSFWFQYLHLFKFRRKNYTDLPPVSAARPGRRFYHTLRYLQDPRLGFRELLFSLIALSALPFPKLWVGLSCTVFWRRDITPVEERNVWYWYMV